MRRGLLLCVLVVGLASPGWAQLHNHGSGLAHGIPDVCATDPTALIVPAGSPPRTLVGPLVLSCLGIHGDVTIASEVKASTVIVYDDGRLTLLDGAHLVGRDTPIDRTADPETYTNGLICFGYCHAIGQTVVPFVRSGIPGVPPIPNLARTITIESENPLGVRWHFLATNRADIDVRYVAFKGMGRTDGRRRIDSTTISPDDNVVTHLGDDQIGRYTIHLHHVFGPVVRPANGYQFTLIGNAITDDSKWAITVHNSSFGLIQDNVIVGGVGSGLVEEDGSETGNLWQGNLVVDIHNPTMIAAADESGYNPQGRRPSCGWFRGINQILRDNICVRTESGFGFWTGCAEDGPCSPNVYVTVPKFPGADTTIPANLEICKDSDGLPTPCQVRMRVGLEQSGNEFYDLDLGIEYWWTARIQTGSPPITTTRMVRVRDAILQRYSDVAWDGCDLLGTGPGAAVSQGNDGHPVGRGIATSVLAHCTIRNFRAAWERTGQLGQAAGWLVRDSSIQSAEGFKFRPDGQANLGARDAAGVERPTFTWANVEFLPMPGLPLRTIQTGPATTTDVGVRREFDLRVKTPTEQYRVWFLQPSGGEPAAPCTVTRPDIVGFVCPVDAVTIPVIEPPIIVPPKVPSCSYMLPGSTVLQTRPIGAVLRGTTPIGDTDRVDQLQAWGWSTVVTGTTQPVVATCVGGPQ